MSVCGQTNTGLISNSRLEIKMSLEQEIDQFFQIVMGVIVVFLQAGFAFLEAGSVRSKNVTNILIKNMLDQFVSGVAYWIFGYAFAYGEGNSFIGWSYFALHDLPPTKMASFFFQYAFAATAATIISGSVAERCELIAYFTYSFFITGFIYPVVSRWQWYKDGFLVNGVDYGGDIGVVGYTDFAGSGVMHVLGGVAAFCGAWLLGPRIGRFHTGTGATLPVRGHSVPLIALGGFILIVGFFAFNGGANSSISQPGDGSIVALCIVNTVLAASFSAFSSLVINRIKIFGTAKWSLLATINGALTGMVASCAGVNAVEPWASSVVGLMAGIVYHISSKAMLRMHIDDPLDAVTVHFSGGVLGVIAVAFFHSREGILYNWNRRSGLILAWNIAGLFLIIAWTAITSLTLFGALKRLNLLRVPEEMEIKGLDIPKHDEPAYPPEAYGYQNVVSLTEISENNSLKHGKSDGGLQTGLMNSDL